LAWSSDSSSGFLLRLVDAADVADQVAAHLAERVVAEQPRLDLHPGETEALRGEARHLLVGELGADGQRLEAFALVHQALETLAVARLDLHHLGQAVDGSLEVGHLRRGDLERVGRVVVGQHHAVAVDDEAAVGHDRHHRDAVVIGLGGQLVVFVDLQVDEPRAEQGKADQHEGGRSQQSGAEAPEFLFDVLELCHSGRF
jgi:hypothetical protein